MNFNYFNPTKIITGEGCVIKNAGEFLQLGKSCLIVTGGSSAKKSGALDDAAKALESVGITYMVFDEIEPNPTMESCVKAGNFARDNGLEFVLGIGGGSPLDAAKAAAVYAANDMEDGTDIYKNDWKTPALPIAAIGTTAGTGSEVTCFSIITRPDGHKKSFGNAETYPRVMFGDARYTFTLPVIFTASTALDALSHALEAYFSSAANYITDMFAMEATAILCKQLALLKSTKDISDITANQREQLYLASIIAGYSLSQCGTLYCHTLSYFFTENYGTPHGFACAATLPDLIMRCDKYAHDKSVRLFEKVNISPRELCRVIESICPPLDVKIPKDVIESVSEAGTHTNNFKKLIPGGFSKEDSIEMLTRLFG